MIDSSKIKIDLKEGIYLKIPTSHNQLDDLAYEHSGHIGFASEKELNKTNLKVNTLEQDLQEANGNISNLQENAITIEEREKLSGIENNAQVNKVETISINGGNRIQADNNKNINLTVAITSGVKLEYNATTGVISLLDKDNVVLSSVDLPLELLIQSGSYNIATQNIELVLANGEKILIPASDLVDEYNADGTTITMGSNNTFSVAQAVLDRITSVESVVNSGDLATKEYVNSLIQTSINSALEGDY